MPVEPGRDGTLTGFDGGSDSRTRGSRTPGYRHNAVGVGVEPWPEGHERGLVPVVPVGGGRHWSHGARRKCPKDKGQRNSATAPQQASAAESGDQSRAVQGRLRLRQSPRGRGVAPRFPGPERGAAWSRRPYSYPYQSKGLRTNAALTATSARIGSEDAGVSAAVSPATIQSRPGPSRRPLPAPVSGIAFSCSHHFSTRCLTLAAPAGRC